MAVMTRNRPSGEMLGSLPSSTFGGNTISSLAGGSGREWSACRRYLVKANAAKTRTPPIAAIASHPRVVSRDGACCSDSSATSCDSTATWPGPDTVSLDSSAAQTAR